MEKIYANLIKNKVKNIEGVPSALKEAAQALFDAQSSDPQIYKPEM